jgi:4a-hydroxytetrahydrobiopterin dehydratase
MSRRLDVEEINRQLSDLPNWSFVRASLHARFKAPDFPTAVRLVSAVAEVAEEMNHHPDMDVRWRTVRFELSTHSEGGVTQLDVELAHRITAEATQLGAEGTGPAPSAVEIGIDTTNRDEVLPFWRAVLAYVDDTDEDGEPQLRDPAGLRPVVWFQALSSPRTERNRLHVDVFVPASLAEQRVRDTLAAGGRLVTGEHAPAWWVLADAEGNEAYVCTDA